MPFNNYNNATFEEGIRAGGLRSKNEIKTLICYMLNAVNTPISKKIIIDSLQNDAIANYFESSSCFDDLVKNDCIQKCDDNTFILTDNGKIIAMQLETTLPLTIREKVFQCMMKLLEKTRIEKENKVEIEKLSNGFLVHCTISGGETDLFKFSLYAPDYNDAKFIKKNFLKNPTLVYKTMLSLLSKNKDVIKDTLLDIEKLN